MRHQRISTVGTREHELESGITVSPSKSMGLREDGIRGQWFLGMELDGGIGFTSSLGYQFFTKGEVLFADTIRIQEWGMSGKFAYDLANDGLGLQLNVTPEWGRNMLIAENALWGSSVLVENFDSGMHTSGAQVNAEIGYGLSLWGDFGRVKPFGGILLSETQKDKYRFGTRVNLDSGVELGFESSRSLENGGANEDEVKLKGSIRW